MNTQKKDKQKQKERWQDGMTCGCLLGIGFILWLIFGLGGMFEGMYKY